MKLSDAIVLGSTVLALRSGVLLSRNGKAGCALGMASKAMGLQVTTPHCTFQGVELGLQPDYEPINTTWPWLLEYVDILPCGCSPEEEDDYADAIIHLFD